MKVMVHLATVLLLFGTSAVTVSAGGEEARLGIVFDGTCPETAVAACVMVTIDGHVVYKQVADLRKPVLASPVPIGRAVITLLPSAGSNNGRGATGEITATVEANRMTFARITLKIIEGTPVATQLQGFDGEPLGSQVVTVTDVTQEDQSFAFRIATDAEGKLSFNGFAGRKYRLRITKSLPEVTDFVSQEIAVRGEPQNVTWRLKKPVQTGLRFLIDKKGKKAPFLSLETIHVNGWLVNVEGGAASLLSTGDVLGKTEEATVALLPDLAKTHEIVQNRTFLVTADEDREVVIVIAPRQFGHLLVNCSLHPDAVGVSMPRLVVLKEPSSKRRGSLSADKKNLVPVGEYRIAAWCEGSVLASADARVLADRTTTVKLALDKAPLLKGHLVDSTGNPVAGAHVEVLYLAFRGMGGRTRCDGTGQFSLAIADTEDTLIRVRHKTRGSTITRLSVSDLGKEAVLAFPACQQVSGTLDVSDVRSRSGSGMWRILWVSDEFPSVMAARCRVDSGKYSIMLPPGKYTRYVAGGADALKLDSVLVPDGKTIEFPPIIVTRGDWRRATTMYEHGVYKW
jgi:hypothetical protein